MMRQATLAVVPVSCLFVTAASAEDRCLAGLYRAPANLVDEMRPYLVCGMIQGYGHHTVRVNGVGVTMNGGGPETCGRLRAAAVEASERRLVSVMPDAAARRRFVEAEFDAADRFMQVAARSVDLAIGEEPTAPSCRSDG